MLMCWFYVSLTQATEPTLSAPWSAGTQTAWTARSCHQELGTRTSPSLLILLLLGQYKTRQAAWTVLVPGKQQQQGKWI